MSDVPADDEAISYYPVPPESDLPPDLQKLFAKARQTMGFVPNVFRTYSFRPERLSAWFSHYRQLHVPTDHLSEAEREMIAVTVSMANGCLYCLVAHGAALRQALGDPVLADRITFDYRRAGLGPKQRAVLDYAWKITRTPADCDETDIAHLRALGLTLEEVWDVSEIAAMYNFTNRMAMATGQLPNREYHYLVRSAD
jgi:uncharacterized peroxidase-related enzyme